MSSCLGMSGLCSESDPTRWDKDSEMGSKGMSSDTKDSFLASVASNHSSKIGLMQNLQTGSISPQFHVVFDELFLTAHSVDEDNGTWIELFTSECDYFEPDKEEEEDDGIIFPEVNPTWLPIAELLLVPPVPIIAECQPDHSQYTHYYCSTRCYSCSRSTTRRCNHSPDATIEHQQPNTQQDPPERGRRTRRPNRRVLGDKWTNNDTLQLTPSSRTLLGHIVPTLSCDNLFLHLLD